MLKLQASSFLACTRKLSELMVVRQQRSFSWLTATIRRRIKRKNKIPFFDVNEVMSDFLQMDHGIWMLSACRVLRLSYSVNPYLNIILEVSSPNWA